MGTQDATKPVLVSWDLTIWPNPSAEKTSDDKASSGAQSRLTLFEEIILPHLDAAYNLARWLTRNDQDAQDVVQESYLRAFRFFDGYRGGDGKAWLLAVVRNTCRTWQRRQSRESGSVPFDEMAHSGNILAPDQEQSMVDREKAGALRSCLEKLPIDFREVLVMRELEEMSYQEIADALGLALGTVMSRLSRARKRLEECAASRTLEAAR
jgi:RNA polymerase sigma-70 factor (ECF subfamily)